jgi:hypothetical protein
LYLSCANKRFHTWHIGNPDNQVAVDPFVRKVFVISPPLVVHEIRYSFFHIQKYLFFGDHSRSELICIYHYIAPEFLSYTDAMQAKQHTRNKE